MREKSQNERNSYLLEKINAFGSILMHTTSVEDSVWAVTENVIENLGYTDCIIYLINDDGELYQCAAHGNKNPTAQEIQNPIKLKMGEGICGHVALTGIGEIIADTSKDHRYTVDDKYRYSEITVPVLSDGNVIGIIDSEHPEKGYFSDHDLIILNTIASMLSLKISQTKAIDELEIHENKRLNELIISNTEKQKQADKLALANKVLIEKNERLKEFTYIISHDIRKHSANLKLISEVIDSGDFEEKKIYYSMMVKSIDHLSMTVDYISEIVDIDKDSPIPEIEIYLADFVDKITESLTINTPDITIRNSIPKGINLKVRAGYVNSICENLISNAIQYKSGNNSSLVISAVETDKDIVLVFKDNGLGMDLEKIGNKLFNMYATFHGNKEAKGLGLFLVKKYIEALEWKITVASEVGKGTEFKILISKNHE